MQGVTNALDLTAIVNYFKAPSTISLSTMSTNQQQWLDANRDGVYANAGDVLFAARAFAGATVYPVFEELSCPHSSAGELTVTVACYSAAQAVLSNVQVAVELSYSVPLAASSTWLLSSGSLLAATAAPNANFALGAVVSGRRELRVRPSAGWQRRQRR